ncbi:GNAT family N-acetyltransferase [Oceanobacillus sp. FSL K6-2867]|uniref:GNAT family N-acetyltransferase n=1 Tax=Oceanobacillus sp. FSL K6-2867 TaxID=2954748 RepID=UPI0030DB3504
MLTKEYLHDIKRLQLLCEANDQITLKLNWDMLQNRETDEKNDFFLYDNNEFIAFLGLYGFGNKAEICGMVKPEYRRKGIFSKLLDEALEVCKTRKYKEVLLNAPAASATAKSFLKAIPCEHSSTEYQMKWSFMELHEEKDVLIRTSLTDQDLKAEIQLDISCFDFMEDEAVDYNRRIRKDGNQQFFIIESDEKIVGKIRVAHEGKEARIYGFLFFLNFREKELEE